jgi:enterochelin esterase-like enzyme
LLNDGQEISRLRVKEIVDSLFSNAKIQPLIVVAIHAGDRLQEYGVAGKPDYAGRGNKAGYYDAFINNELYPFVKKKTGTRKFRNVAFAGSSLGGLSAFDFSWNHPEKVNKVGVFSGSFWWRDKDTTDSTYSDEKNRIIFTKLKSSRKDPNLQYWFYAGGNEETSDRDKDGVVDVIDDTKDIINLLKQKNPSHPIMYKEVMEAKHDWPYWSAVLPDFLIWAFGK